MDKKYVVRKGLSVRMPDSSIKTEKNEPFEIDSGDHFSRRRVLSGDFVEFEQDQSSDETENQVLETSTEMESEDNV